jgi:GntR family transcriptional regulator, sialic acid-inducible nan operon repressor
MSDVLLIQPLRRRKVYEQVAERIEELISSRALHEGDALPSERDLMKLFDVGRPAIREAMLSLEKSGLLTISNGERARVSHPTTERMLEGLSSAARLMLSDAEGMRHFQAARRMFEGALVREAARRATEQDIRALRAALEANDAASGDFEAFERTDVEFHLQIIRMAGNPIFLALHRALSEWLIDQRRTSLRRKGAEAQARRFHRQIFEAIAARDPDAAEETMLKHLDSVNKLYWEQQTSVAVDRPKPGSTRRSGS